MNFRKISGATWSSPRDPTCYGELDLDLPNNFTGSPLPLVCHRVAQAFKTEPQASSFLSFGLLRKRKSIDITVVVQPDNASLQFVTLKNCDRLTENEIAEQILKKSSDIKSGKSNNLAGASVWIDWVPWFLLPIVLGVYQFLAFDLGLSLKWIGLPPWPFGSVIISNIGNFGIQRGFAPIVPITRSVMTVTIAKLGSKPVWRDNQWKKQDFVPLGVAFDHRILDGVHAGRLLQGFLTKVP